MEKYTPRKVRYKELVEVGDWKVKIYLVSKTGELNHEIFYKNVLARLQNWFLLENSFNASHNHVAFLILHPASEGIFSIINWWVGENMLNSHVFLTEYDSPTEFKKISGDGLGSCVWEMDVINHERLAWLEHVIKKMPFPKIEEYLKDIINSEI